jgi:hypothetical protein
MQQLRLLSIVAAIYALSGCGGGGGSGGGVPDPVDDSDGPPGNFEFSASVVIGQSAFNANLANRGNNNPSVRSVSQPFGSAEVVGGVLYLPDTRNSRVLGFNTIPIANNTEADFVLGQAGFTTKTDGDGASQMEDPKTVVAHNGQFFVSDFTNNRVLIYNAVPGIGPGTADVVVGQTGFDVSTSGCSATQLKEPESIAIDTVNDKLIVADSDNNRVLIWNSIPTTHGDDADVVLGQNSFTTCFANNKDQDGDADTSPNASVMNYPSGVWTDGTKLAVVDTNNSRVLIWNTFPTSNFDDADLVIGQEDFDLRARNDNNGDGDADETPSRRTLYLPLIGIESDGVNLIVSDTFNHRVLIWDAFPTTNFEPADHVIGQENFSNNSPNDTDQDDDQDQQPSRYALGFPFGLKLEGTQLIVTDEGNSRYLIFDL